MRGQRHLECDALAALAHGLDVSLLPAQDRRDVAVVGKGEGLVGQGVEAVGEEHARAAQPRACECGLHERKLARELGEVRAAVVANPCHVRAELVCRREADDLAHAVGKDDQRDRANRLRRGVRAKELELARVVLAGARAGGVPEDRERRDGWCVVVRRGGRLVGGAEPHAAVCVALEERERCRKLGQGDAHRTGGRDVLLVGGHAPADLGHADALAREAADRGGDSAKTLDLDRDSAALEVIDGHGKLEGRRAVRVKVQRCHIAEPHRALAARRHRVHAGAVGVATHLLDDARVCPAPLLGLEDHARLLLGDDDAVDHLSVDVERVAAHGGAVGQGDAHLRREVAWVGVVDHQRLGYLGEHPAHVRLDLEGPQLAGLVL